MRRRALLILFLTPSILYYLLLLRTTLAALTTPTTLTPLQYTSVLSLLSPLLLKSGESRESTKDAEE